MAEVWELAGGQDDPFTEEVLAVLFSDRPERYEVRPEDNRRHVQWMIESPVGQTSRGWIGFAEPITTEQIELLQRRYKTALEQAFVPDFATQVEVTVQQIRVNELRLAWIITRTSAQVVSGAVILSQGE